MSDASSSSETMRQRFGRNMRLSTYDVATVLKRGKRVRSQLGSSREQTIFIKPCIEARVIARTEEDTPLDLRVGHPAVQSGARLAVAVPKRLLKKAVERNLVKRWMREALRQHAARKTAVDVLLTLTAKVNLNIAIDCARVKQQINDLLAIAADLSAKRKLPTRN